MTRISSSGHTQTLIQHMMRAQQDLADSRVRVSTGKVAQQFKGLGHKTQGLIGAKALASRTESFLNSNRELAQRLEVNNMAMGGLGEIADTFRSDVIKALELNSGLGFAQKLRDGFERAVGLLQTKHNGQYIFGGTRSDVSPVNATDETAFLALAASSDIFQNNTIKAQARIDENQTMQHGMLASEVANALMSAFYRIMQFNSGTLPSGAGAYAPAAAFADPLTPNQRDFLNAELANVQAAITEVRTYETNNGVRMGSLDKVIDRQSEELAFVTGFVSDIENADLPEAITKLNEDQNALEATMQVLARIGRLSLLDFV